MGPEIDDTCRCHSKHTALLQQHEKRLDGNHEDHGELWTAIKDKVSFKWFSLFVLIFVGNLGFQMAIYSMVKDTQAAVQVIKAEIKTNDKGKGNHGGQ